MPYFTGTVQAKNLYTTIRDLITQVQPGENVAWWKNESSLATDGALTSTGSTGSERIVIVLREHTVGLKMVIGTARDYTPGAVNTAGTFDELNTQEIGYYTAAQTEAALVTYDLNVTKDRIILHLQGDKLISTWGNPIAFVGMPIRYDVNDRKCVVHAISESAVTANKCIVVENSIGQTKQSYDWYYTASPANPSWGNNVFLETFHFGLAGEGLRGELDGIFGCHPDGMVDGDDVDVAGVMYKVIQRKATGNNGFPRTCYLMKKS